MKRFCKTVKEKTSSLERRQLTKDSFIVVGVTSHLLNKSRAIINKTAGVYFRSEQVPVSSGLQTPFGVLASI